MTDTPALPIEAYIDRVSLDRSSIGNQVVRAGYRRGEYDLVSIDLPIQLLEKELAAHLEVVIRLTPSGQIAAHLVGSSGSPLPESYSTTSIEQLVSEAVCAENIRLEEITPNELRRLISSLEAAIDQARAALAVISEPSHRNTSAS
ncbi:hypothetical protein H8A97_00025 [Bradyrhizobium sp. Arg62]|uniref:hypothetical protein n=1 Tax=Bradyrhizobium brasilense TaxID=1419277 RepID=UPI001E486AA7|nr:hypothetical protein [Bradyrhizobium brasilense]MCC8943528.1 hypothetical protein [Bradyrhizobium brasilense]